MCEKIKVKKEIADAIVWSIQWHKENRPELETIRDIHAEMLELSTSESFQGEYEEVLNEVPTFELAEMLIKGYEIEQTPEERILEYYFATNWVQEKDAINFVLNTLNIEIEGINKEEGQYEDIK